MSSNNFNVDTILKLVDLGLRVGTVLVERHSNQSISAMSDAEILAAIDKINIHTDSAIEAGENRAAAAKGITRTETVDRNRNPVDTIHDEVISDFEDEGDDQGHPV